MKSANQETYLRGKANLDNLEGRWKEIRNHNNKYWQKCCTSARKQTKALVFPHRSGERKSKHSCKSCSATRMLRTRIFFPKFKLSKKIPNVFVEKKSQLCILIGNRCTLKIFFTWEKVLLSALLILIGERKGGKKKKKKKQVSYPSMRGGLKSMSLFKQLSTSSHVESDVLMS